MKRIMIALLVVSVLGPAVVFAEVTLKEIKGPDGTTQMVFYSEGKEIAKQIKDKHDNIVKTVGKIPDGLVTQYYDSGRVKAELNYKNSKRQGICKFFFESGVLEEETNFKNDKKDGICKMFFKNGSLKVKMEFRNGKFKRIIEIKL